MADAEMAASDIAVDLPKMRVSYEEGTLSENELASTWHEQLQNWLDDAIRAGAPGAQRDGPRHGERRRPARVTDRVMQGPRRPRRRLLHQLHVREEPRPARPRAIASATFPWYTPAPPGDRARRGREGEPGRDQRPTGRAARAAPSSARGPRRSPSWSVGAARWRTRSRTSSAASPTPRRCRSRRTGAAGASGPEVVEFWQGRRDRMHDRLQFKLQPGRLEGRARRPDLPAHVVLSTGACTTLPGAGGRRSRIRAVSPGVVATVTRVWVVSGPKLLSVGVLAGKPGSANRHRHAAAAHPGLPAALGVHRHHRGRGAVHRRRGAQADLRHHRVLRLRRADRASSGSCRC